MMKYFSHLLGFVALCVVCWPVAALAANAPNGSYRRSCTIRGFDGVRLEAFCAPESGPNFRLSQMDVRPCGGEIFNRDGGLQCFAGGGTQGSGRAIPRGGYVDTCKDIIVANNQSGMAAQCKNRGGSYRATSMSFNGCPPGSRIDNDDGRLVCRR